jgi:mono/diheme cytochrome c family protein
MRTLLILTSALFLTVACGGNSSPDPKPEPVRDPPKTQAKADKPVEAPPFDAAAVFKVNCSTCHGEGGAGDGVAGAALDPKPRDFTDAAWWDTVTDDHVKTVFTKGGPAAGKSAMMAPFGHLFPTPENQDAMVTLLKAMASE